MNLHITGWWTRELLVTSVAQKSIIRCITLCKSLQVTLGDGHQVEAIGTGVVTLKLNVPGRGSQIGRLDDVFYVPKLTYNLLSVPKVTEAGNNVFFDKLRGYVRDSRGELVTVASKMGNLYYLNSEPPNNCQVHAVSDSSRESIWHRRWSPRRKELAQIIL